MVPVFAVIYFLSLSFVRSENGAVYREKSEFVEYTKLRCFVDKSMLLKLVFEAPSPLLITTPAGFGKSTNLLMMEAFFSECCAEAEKARRRAAFAGMEIARREARFYDDHFASHPVVHVDFDFGPEDEEEGVVTAAAHLRQALQRAFERHDYLLRSDRLDEGELRSCQTWCSANYLLLADDRWQAGLAELVALVRKHHGRRVLLLVDHYDAFNNAAVFGGVDSEKEARAAVALTAAVLKAALRDRNALLRAVIVGDLPATASTIRELNCYPFLEQHPFVKYYGFTQNEVRELFARKTSKMDAEDTERALTFYSGYVSQAGETIYNPFSVTSYVLHNGMDEEYWGRLVCNSGFIMKFQKYPELVNKFDELLRRNTVTVKIPKRFSLQEMLRLRKVCLDRVHRSPDLDLLFSLFLRLGYLVHAAPPRHNSRLEVVKLPNEDVRECFLTACQEYHGLMRNPEVDRRPGDPIFSEDDWTRGKGKPISVEASCEPLPSHERPYGYPSV